jgi:hypothetical protein
MFEGLARALCQALLFAGAIACGGRPTPAIEATIATRPRPPEVVVRSPAVPIPTSAEAGVTFPERDDAHTPLAMRCGAFVVRRDKPADGVVSVADSRERIILEIKPIGSETIDVAWCADVDGDGRPELAYFKYSGGAHCCRTDVVVTLDDRTVERLRYEAGSGGGLRMMDVDGDGALELVSHDDAVLELDDLPYVAAPLLPVVFAREGERYVRRTTRFRKYLSEARRDAETDLAGCEKDPACEIGRAEAVLGLSLLLGDWHDASKRMSLEPDARRTVMAAAPRLAKILRTRGELLP